MKRKMRKEAKAISDRVSMIVPHDGCILQVPADVGPEEAQQLSAELHRIWPNRNFLLVAGNIRQLSEEEMNKQGWYRQPHAEAEHSE